MAFSSSYFQEYVRRFMEGDDVSAFGSMEQVSTHAALKYTAVFACLRVLGEAFASAPAMLYRKTGPKGNDRETRNDLAVYEILHNIPNEEMSPLNFKEACMNALNLGGNTVSERLVTRRGELVGLYPYQWQQVEIDRDRETQKLVYKINDGKDRIVKKELTRQQVFHVPGPSLDGVIGLSPIEYTARAITLGRSYELFGVNYYKHGTHPSGAFKFPHALKDDAFERLKKELKDNYAGLLRTGTPMILEGGGEFQPFAIKPADAQLIESKKFQIEDIARIYRVPLHLIQNLDRATFSNIEHMSLEFVMYTMLPWFNRWEENINMQLLTPAERRAGFYIEFKVDGLLRGDAKTRAEAYAVGRQWGWLSVNDIRKLENMPPIDNGDIYLQPMNMVEAGQEASEGAVTAMAEKIYQMIKEGGEGA